MGDILNKRFAHTRSGNRGFKKDWAGRLKGKRISLICHRHGYVKGEYCPKCVEMPISEGIQVQTFKPMWYEHITTEPIYVTSKRQLKEECRKHNVVAARLL